MNVKGLSSLIAVCLSFLVFCGCGKKAEPVANGEPDPVSIGCAAYLKQIDQAKKSWAQQHGSGANDTPTADDLEPFFRHGMPKCPGGGTYTIGSVSELPQCSIAAHNDYFKADLAPPPAP
ncbi:MAG TPA: hypothetical protein VGO59_10115 [Verrucomicrobiae bacterium]